MSTDVKVNEVVSSTLLVFGRMHNAFLSATPSQLKISVEEGSLANNKRLLKDFKFLFTRAIDSSRTLAEPNEVKAALKDSKFEANGEALIGFANTWAKYVEAGKGRSLPTKREVIDVKKQVAELSAMSYGEATDTARILFGEALFKMYHRSRTLKIGLRTTDALGGLESHNRVEQTRTRGDMYGTPGVDKRAVRNLTRSEIADKLERAKQILDAVDTVPLDTTTASWLEFVELGGGEIDISEFSGEEFEIQKATAIRLLRSIDLMYLESGLGDALIAFLGTVAKKCEAMAASDGRPGSTVIEHDRSGKLASYSKQLRNLATDVSAFKIVVDLSKVATSFAMQFPLPLKSISDTGHALGALWGSSEIQTGWKKPSPVSFSPDLGKIYSMSSGASGASGITGKSSTVGTTGGPLSRVIDMDRVKECTDMVGKFVTNLDSSDSATVTNLSANVATTIAGFVNEIAKLDAKDPDTNSTPTDGLKDQQARSVRSFLNRAKGVMTRHQNRHVMFALRYNRVPMRYMFYWRDCGDPAFRTIADNYTTKLKEAYTKGVMEIDKILVTVVTLINNANTYKGLSDPDIDGLVSLFENIRAFGQQCKDRIIHVHTTPSTFIDQLSSDTHAQVIYVLKVVRFGLAWLSLSIATKAFTSMYASNVYIKNTDPPAPTLFLAMFFGVDFALNAGLLTILWASNMIFKSPSNDFPIDGYMLSAWSVDVACSELVLVSIAFAFGNIISTKKAFRYRQEGDRGIRALGQMMLYTYAVILVIPFFRIL